MRITFLTPHDSLNGGIRVVALYARRLQARGHEVMVVSNPRERPGLREQARALRRGQWRELREKTRPQAGHLVNAGVPFRRLETSRRIVASDLPDADVVVATWWETADWMAALPERKGLKVHMIQGYETWADPAQAARVDAALRLDNLKIAISGGLKRDIESRLGGLGIHVIPNAVDTVQFDAPARARQDPPRIGFVYAQNPIKGADRCYRIVEQVRRHIPGLQVLAFGTDKPSADMPLPPGTEYHRSPAQESLAGLYARCDAWLFATRVDSFGLPILEAMASRTPVVGLPVGAAPELLAEGDGVLVSPVSEGSVARDMAQAVIGLLEVSEPEWRRMSERAHQKAHGYTWEDAADRLESVLVHELDARRADAA